jgi:hypothetical protein
LTVSKPALVGSELVCKDVVLPLNIEEEVKEGFFELKQKFNAQGVGSIYISH